MNDLTSSNNNRLLTSLALVFSLISVAPASFAVDISVSSIRIFRDTISPNAVGFTPGDFLKIEVRATPSPLMNSDPADVITEVTATKNFETFDLVYVNDPVFPEEYNVRIPYRTDLLGSWDITITKGMIPETFPADGIGNVGSSEFVKNMSITNSQGDGRIPKISWTFPDGVVPDEIQVRIYDHQQLNSNGFPERIHRVKLPGNTTSYTVPEIYDDNDPPTRIGLVIGRKYTFQVILDILDQPVIGTLVARSRSFFEAVAVDSAATIPIFLPTPVSGVYNFAIDVSLAEPIIIDPEVAVGYEYEIGAGDPNFASVTLPDIGDGRYMLSYLDGGMQSVNLDANIPFTFPTGGVSAFTVTDIETSAGLDPTNTTAFMTTLTFVADGLFTGTMKPITQLVPDTINVLIDIKPLSKKNKIQPKSQRWTRVAILGSGDFDALQTIVSTVRFGPNGAQAISSVVFSHDINRDGFPDLTLFFETRKTGIQCGDEEATITGETYLDANFVGTGSIKKGSIQKCAKLPKEDKPKGDKPKGDKPKGKKPKKKK